MADKAPAKPATRSAKDIEADLAATRERLTGTIDELAFRAQPKELAKRQVEGAKLKVGGFTHTPDGELNTQKLGFALGGVAAVLLTLGILRRARG
ncbi:hypothetical protein GCM10011492_02640 [Flexivirga endophytica]|uniref:DUF3618 domain-containing protein n=1 Tax=Flexivirga endophytica TaxID=1849103 RepID=A0A916SSU5_9MICO|nr:DUF3618 domain-containing protein [Flexivirga endophytica]GGB16371.1 hypothetical protein GCM10011492_02640 [Flexivirga endophytica]GHB39213.1 hypothetical protein GCM10008112_04970 [Flexivirga endophytica]